MDSSNLQELKDQIKEAIGTNREKYVKIAVSEKGIIALEIKNLQAHEALGLLSSAQHQVLQGQESREDK